MLFTRYELSERSEGYLMSRIGCKPVPVPDGVKVNIDGNFIEVIGPKGKLKRSLHHKISVKVTDNSLLVQRLEDNKQGKSFHGLYRSLISNMVTGVSTGYEKALEARGIGYRAQVQNKKLVLNLGHSHSVDVDVPDGITVEIVKRPVIEQLAVVRIVVKGINKEEVGKFAAEVRALRPPEPYKGKGVRNVGEYVRRKAGKKAT